MTAPRRPRIACATLALLLTLAGCAEAEPPPENRILVLDGITIGFDDVAPYVAFLDSFLPESGRKNKVMMVVREYLLPLRLAERAFAAERASERERAAALASVVDNVLELERQTELMQHKRRSKLARMKAQLPVAMFLFDELTTGSVSQPLAVPQGWIVTGAFELVPGSLLLDDYVDALQVGFVTHTSGEWADWYAAEQARIADRCTFVHPEYRDSLPDWIRPPERP